MNKQNLNKKSSEERFVAWLITQTNSRGTLYLERVARQYARYLRTEPLKLINNLEQAARNVFLYESAQQFEDVYQVFLASSNYKEVNRQGHQAFSAGLAAYRRYLNYLDMCGEPNVGSHVKCTCVQPLINTPRIWSDTELERVDFNRAELCTGCNPVTCMVEGIVFSGRTWRDILVSLTEAFLQSKPRAQELYFTSLYPRGAHAFLLKEKPRLSSRKLANGYWLNVHFSIKDLVLTIGRLCEFCGIDINDVNITYTPKQSMGGLRPMNISHDESTHCVQRDTRSTFQECNNSNLADAADSNVPDVLVDALGKHYASGFRFDATYINLLSNVSGLEIDSNMQLKLKNIMFCRNDNIYFLLETVANGAIRKEIMGTADAYLEKYGCFEIVELYNMYEQKVNPNCIRNSEDFESFYNQICQSVVRCVQAPYVGNRVARYSNGTVWSIFKDVASKIVDIIADEYCGSCNEEDLHSRFSMFSTDLLGKIIKQCAADTLIRVEINDSICYQTFDALGLPENFSELLADALEQITDIGLDPTQDVLHTILSIKLGVNFRLEYNLPDWDTYRRLIAEFYTAEPRREWKNNIYGEVPN